MLRKSKLKRPKHKWVLDICTTTLRKTKKCCRINIITVTILNHLQRRRRTKFIFDQKRMSLQESYSIIFSFPALNLAELPFQLTYLPIIDTPLPSLSKPSQPQLIPSTFLTVWQDSWALFLWKVIQVPSLFSAIPDSDLPKLFALKRAFPPKFCLDWLFSCVPLFFIQQYLNLLGLIWADPTVRVCDSITPEPEVNAQHFWNLSVDHPTPFFLQWL